MNNGSTKISKDEHMRRMRAYKKRILKEKTSMRVVAEELGLNYITFVKFVHKHCKKKQ